MSFQILLSSSHVVMYTLYYFKEQSETLLSPNGTLSSFILSCDITVANHLVNYVGCPESVTECQIEKPKKGHTQQFLFSDRNLMLSVPDHSSTYIIIISIIDKQHAA